MLQRKLARPLPKDDTQIHEAFLFFFFLRKQSWRWIDYGHPSSPHQGRGDSAEKGEAGLPGEVMPLSESVDQMAPALCQLWRLPLKSLVLDFLHRLRAPDPRN